MTSLWVIYLVFTLLRTRNHKRTVQGIVMSRATCDLTHTFVVFRNGRSRLDSTWLHKTQNFAPFDWLFFPNVRTMNKDNSTYVFLEPSSNNNSNFISSFMRRFESLEAYTHYKNIFKENENVLRSGRGISQCLEQFGWSACTYTTRSRCALGNWKLTEIFWSTVTQEIRYIG